MADRHATLRTAAIRLLDFLSEQQGPSIDRQSLAQDLFTITPFDIESNDLSNPTHEPGEDQLGQSFSDFAPISNPKNIREKISQQPRDRAYSLQYTIESLFMVDIRKSINKPLAKETGWSCVNYPNDFFYREGLLSNRGRKNGWNQVILEKTLQSSLLPHIMLMAVQGAIAKDNEILLGELAPIVQCIRNRLEQEEFTDTAFFPVLSVSFCGPQHGRIIQGCFNQTGVLELKISKIYSFMTRAEAPFDLFVRFLANEPTGYPEQGLQSAEASE